jgi:hypothetical protein
MGRLFYYGGLMNRHWKDGYQRNFINDIYRVEEQLQAYDPYLYIMFNPETGKWLLMDEATNMAIMGIPQIGFETLDSRLVDHIKRIHTATGFSASWEVEEHEKRMEKERQRQLDDMAQDYAKEMAPAAREAFTTGRTTGVNKYVQGGAVHG